MITLPMSSDEIGKAIIRSHPWKSGENGAAYYNFVEHPELIRSVLEDFKAHDHHAGVVAFYELIEEINSESSIFESNDCGMFVSNHNSCMARVEVLYRRLKLNLCTIEATRLRDALFIHIHHHRPDAKLPLVRIGILDTTYPRVSENKRDGYRIRISIYFNLTADAVPFSQLGDASSALKQCFSQFSVQFKKSCFISDHPAFHIANET